ncbi:MAG: DUF6597 domain-containing transcriptional factor [Thermomicrobiales bacterium]
MNDRDGRPSGYREVPPPAHLRDQIECFWHRDAGATRSDGWVIPDGCVDIIWSNGIPPFVAGPATVPTRAHLNGGTEVTGVRFRPGVANRVLGVDAWELLNQDVPLRAMWPHGRAARWEDTMSRPVLAEKLDGVAQLIAARLSASDEHDPIVGRIVAWIARHPRGDLKEIAQSSGLSERQIRRRFHQTVGYGPKTLQRVLRMQRLLWLASMDAQQIPSLTRLAFAAGYADQPHMTREVVALTGATPRQLLHGSRRGSAVSELFKTTLHENGTLTLPE